MSADIVGIGFLLDFILLVDIVMFSERLFPLLTCYDFLLLEVGALLTYF